MTMDQMYQGMKDVLNFFGLRFGDMDQVSMSISDTTITYTYKNVTISVDLESINEQT